MNIVIDKHSARNDLGKILGAFLGSVVFVVGLAVPAYGQVGIGGTECTGTFGDPVATGHTPTADTAPAGDDPSSLAAGCDARAETDGSVAIGDGATVNHYLGEPLPVVVERTRTDSLMIAGATDSGVGEVGHANGKEYFAVVVDDPEAGEVAYYYESEDVFTALGVTAGPSTGQTIDELVAEIIAADSALDSGTHTYNVNVGVTTTTTIDPTPLLGAESIAIGAGTDEVTGVESVAIGAGAQVGALATTRTETLLGVLRTDILMITGATDSGPGEVGHMDGKEYFTFVVDEVVYYYESEAALDAAIAAGTAGPSTGQTIDDLVAEIVAADSALDSGTLDYEVTVGVTTTPATRTIPVDAAPADRAVAIGAGVTAGTNQIRVGSDTQTDVRIGAYDLGDITTNTAASAKTLTILRPIPPASSPQSHWLVCRFTQKVQVAGELRLALLRAKPQLRSEQTTTLMKATG